MITVTSFGGKLTGNGGWLRERVSSREVEGGQKLGREMWVGGLALVSTCRKPQTGKAMSELRHRTSLFSSYGGLPTPGNRAKHHLLLNPGKDRWGCHLPQMALPPPTLHLHLFYAIRKLQRWVTYKQHTFIFSSFLKLGTLSSRHPWRLL